MKKLLFPIATLLVLFTILPSCLFAQSLKVSDNQRFIVHHDNKPFFWLGDTAWELFHRLNREEADKYLESRAKLGYTVIQAVILAELNGLTVPNPYGNLPLIGLDPTELNEAYFEHCDYIIKKAAELGLYIGLLPTWGDKWFNKPDSPSKIFTPENAEVYGELIGTRYKEYSNIVWVLGGDRKIENNQHREIIEAMARGIKSGDGGNHLISFHPSGGEGSTQYFHDAEWLDFNMRQNGHSISFTKRYYKTLEDYNHIPTKPALDSEPIYEDHPIAFSADEYGHSTSADVRRPLYWNLFSGAFGHTYGHHSVWQMWQTGRTPINRPLMPWFEAINQPGAAQMQYGRWLMESRPFLSRIPDKSIIVPDNIPSSVPGAGSYQFVATRDQDGTYAMVYAPVGRAFTVRMEVIKGSDVVAWWYNPRNGKSTKIGKYPNTGTRTFISPDPGENLDWILVLDDASKKYRAPGSRKK
jgi:hypothetical protein